MTAAGSIAGRARDDAGSQRPGSIAGCTRDDIWTQLTGAPQLAARDEPAWQARLGEQFATA